MPDYKNDIFVNSLSGNVDANKRDYELQSVATYATDPEVMKTFVDNYGEENALDEMKKAHSEVGNTLVKLEQSAQVEKDFQTQDIVVGKGYGHLFGSTAKESNPMYYMNEVNKSRPGGVLMANGEFSSMRKDPRIAHINSRIWYDDEGVAHDMGTWEETSSNGYKSFSMGSGSDTKWGLGLMTGNDDFVNKDGKRIKKFVYAGGSLDPHYRGKAGVQAVYEGDFTESEAVSSLDYNGWTTPDLDQSVAEAIPRSFLGIATGLQEGVGGVGEMAYGAATGEDSDFWQQMTGSAQMASMSVSRATQEDSWNLEGWVGLISDVVGVLALGAGAGKMGAKLAGGLSKSLGKTGVAAANWAEWGGKFGSRMSMTVYGGKGKYDSARAHGFTAREAGFIHAGNLGALYAVNSIFNWADDLVATNNMAKQVTKHLDETLPGLASITGRAAGSTSKMSEKGFMNAVTNNVRTGFKKFKDFAGDSSHLQKGFKGWSSTMTKEAMEEMAEHISEEGVNQIANMYSAMIDTDTKYEDKKFLDVYDEGYWEQFRSGLIQSAVGGFIGGGVGKVMLSTRSQELKDTVVGIYAGGHGDQYVAGIKKKFNKNPEAFGSTTLSTKFDPETGRQLSVQEAGEGEPSVAEATYQSMLSEFNVVKSVLDNLDSKGSIESFLEKNESLKNKIHETSIFRDLRKAQSDYLEIHLKNENLENIVVAPMPKDASEEQRKKHIDKYIVEGENGVTAEEVEKLADIKRTIEDIGDGSASEKYAMQAAAYGTGLLDPTNVEDAEFVAKFGGRENFLENLMKASSESATKDREKSKEVAKRMDENSKELKKLNKDSLENIEEILENIKSADGNIYLKDADRKLLGEVASNYKSSDDITKDIVSYIQEQVKADGVYGSSVIDEAVFRALSRDGKTPDADLVSKAKKFLETYHERKLKGQLSNLTNVASLNDINLEKPQDTLSAIEKFIDDEIGYLGDYYSLEEFLNSEQYSVKEDNVDRFIKFTERSDWEFETPNAVPMNAYKEVGNLANKAVAEFNMLGDALNSINSSPTEKQVAYNPAKLDFLNRLFDGNKESVTDSEGTLKEAFNSIDVAAKTSKTEAGDLYYDNVEETQELLDQHRTRKSQLEAIINSMAGLAEFRYRQAKMKEQPSKAAEVLSSDSKIREGELLAYSGIFDDLLLNPALYHKIISSRYMADIKRAGGPTFWEKLGVSKEKVAKESVNADEVAQFNLLEETAISHANLNKYLDDSIVRLEEILDLAKENSKDESEARKLKKQFAKNIKDEVELAQDLLVSSKLIDSDIPAVKEFNDHYISFDRSKDDSETLGKDFSRVLAVKNMLFKLKKGEKAAALDKFYKSLEKEINYEDGIARQRFINGSLFLHFDHGKFYPLYKQVLSDGISKHLPSPNQEIAAIAVTAHLTTDISNIVDPYLNTSRYEIHDTMFASGLQGTGKTAVVFGLGVKIAQEMQGGKDAKNNRVLFASNNDNQIATLKESAAEFKLSTKNSGYKLAELEAALSDPRTLDDVSAIVFDEATFIDFTNSKSDSRLGVMMLQIKEINAKRPIGQPKLKLVLTGDENQNGFEVEGREQHIGTHKRHIFTSTQLTHPFRSKVSTTNTFLRKILPTGGLGTGSKGTNYLSGELDSLTSQHGSVDPEDANSLKLGIEFTNNPDQAFNDGDLIKNIRKQIEAAKDINPDKPFRVGIITSSGKIPSGSAMETLSREFPNSFRETTHEAVQGDEFDYVVAIMDKEAIGDNKSSWENNEKVREESAAKKLATTIGRARYYSHIVNTTSRVFNSVVNNTNKLPDTEKDNEILKGLREQKISMLPGELEETPDAEVVEEDDSVGEMDGGKVETPTEAESRNSEDDSEEDPAKESPTNEFDNDPTVSSAIDDEESISQKEENERLLIATIAKITDLTPDEKYSEDLYKDVKTDEEFIEASNKEIASNPKTINEIVEVSNPEELAKIEEAFKAHPDFEADPEAVKNRQKEKEEFNQNLERNGILTAYTGDGSGFDATYKIHNQFILSKHASDLVIVDKGEYQEEQLRALGAKKGFENRDKHTYEILVYPWEASPTKVGIVLTATRNGKTVVLGTLPTNKMKLDAGTKLVSLLKKTNEDNNGQASRFKVKNIDQLIDNVSAGELVRGKKIKLSQAIDKLRSMGAHVSNVFVNTQKNDNNTKRGDGFLFYSFNDEFSLGDVKVEKNLVKNVPAAYSKSDKYSKPGDPNHIAFRNMLGMIELDNEATTFEEYDKILGKVNEEDAKELSNITTPSSTSAEKIVQAFTGMIIAYDKVNGSSYSEGLRAAVEEESQTDEVGSALMRRVISDLKKNNRKLHEALGEVFKEISNPASLGKYLEEEGLIKLTQEGRYMKSGDLDSAIAFLPLREGDLEKGIKAAHGFSLLNFMAVVGNQAKLNGIKEPVEILKVIDKLIQGTKSFKKGLWKRPNIYKAGNGNSVFALVDKIPSLMDSYSVTVSEIGRPVIRLNADVIMDNIQNPMSEADTTVDEATDSEETRISSLTTSFIQKVKNIDKEFDKIDSVKELDVLTKSIEDESEQVEIQIGLLSNKKIKNSLIRKFRKTLKPLGVSYSAAYERIKNNVDSPISSQEEQEKLDEAARKLAEQKIEEASLLNEVKTRLDSLTQDFGKSTQFIKTPADVINFMERGDALVKGNEMYMANILEDNPELQDSITEVVTRMKKVSAALANESEANLEEAVAENMGKEYSLEELPNIESLKEGTLSRLLVEYHMAKIADAEGSQATESVEAKAKIADIERRQEELEASRDIETFYDFRNSIPEDTQDIKNKIKRYNEIIEENDVLREKRDKETNKDKIVELNVEMGRTLKENQELQQEIFLSRKSLLNTIPVRIAINEAKVKGQKFLLKIKLAAKSNDWVSSMPMDKTEFDKLNDAVKKVAVKDMEEVTSNEEIIPSIILIDQIISIYDAELAALDDKVEGSGVDTIADIEKRRQEEENKLKKLGKVKIGRYEGIDTDRLAKGREGIILELQDALSKNTSFTKGNLSKEQIKAVRDSLNLFYKAVNKEDLENIVYREEEVGGVKEIIPIINEYIFKYDAELDALEPTQQSSGIEAKDVVYSAVFFDVNEVTSKYEQKHPNLYSHHSTIEFKPKDVSGLPIGQNKPIRIIGRLTTDKVDVLLVENDLSSNEFPHITLSTAEGVKPSESNKALKENQDKIDPLDDTITGQVGVFTTENKEITKSQPTQQTSESAAIAKRIATEFLGQRENTASQEARAIVMTPASDLENYKANLLKLQSLSSKLTAEEYKEALEDMKSQLDDTTVNTGIKRIIAEGREVSEEDLEPANYFTKTVVTESRGENITEGLQKIINSTWVAADNLVNSKITNKAGMLKFEEEYTEVIEKIDSQFENTKGLIVNDILKENLQRQHNERMTELKKDMQNKMANAEREQNLVKDLGNPMAPTFNNVRYSVALSTTTTDIMENLSDGMKSDWTSYINNEWSVESGMDQVSISMKIAKFHMALAKEAGGMASPEYKEMVKFLTNKLRDTRC